MRFDEYLALNGLAGRTIESYKMFYSLYNREHGEIIDQDTINKFILDHNYSLTRYFLKHLLKFKQKKDIEITKISGRKKQKILRYLNNEQIYTMADSFGDSRNNLMIRIGFEGGLRVSEIIQIRPADIDLYKKIIIIRYGKGNKERAIKFSERTKDMLSEYMKDIRGNERLFDITRQRLFTIIKNAGKSALNNSDIHPHILRHSCATHLLEKGMDLKYIQDYLGHANLNTVGIYAHTNKDRMFKLWEDIMG